MKIVSFKLPEYYVELIDKLVKEGLYHSRSEFIRTAVRKVLEREMRRLEHIKKGKSNYVDVSVLEL